MGRLIDEDIVIDIINFECGKWTGLSKTIEKEIKALPSSQPEWGKPVGDGRPLADSEIISRLQDIKAQIGGSYAIDRAIEVLEVLPSAHPEQPPEIQDILDYLDTVLHPIISPEHWNVYSELHDMISCLPSAQTEIIRCKDCKYRDENWRRVSVRWLPCMDVQTGSNWYCGSAERGEQDE